MPRREKRTTLAPVLNHRNEGISSEWSPSDLSLFEDWMRGYPVHEPNKEQGINVPSSEELAVSTTEPPPAFLVDYEAQDFSDEGFGIQVPKEDNPNKSVGEYPEKGIGATDSQHHNDQFPEKEISKGITDTQAWFDSLAEKTGTESVASFRGIPGVNFPDYEDIPSTSFTCLDKQYLPGFYADMDTGCQVFHMCYDNRKVSFLCPVGTLFNQAILTCDYWQNNNCSTTPLYYNSNLGIGRHPHHEKTPSDHKESSDSYQPSSVDNSKGTVPRVQVITPAPNREADQSRNSNKGTVSPGVNQGKQQPEKPFQPQHDYEFSALRYLDLFLKFFPIKAKVTMFPENGQTKVKAVTSIGNSMKQRITIYPVANNSKIVAEATIGQKRRQHRPHVGGYSAGTSAPEILQNQRKGKDIDQEVFNDIDDAFAIVRRVLDHVGRLLPRSTGTANYEGVPSNPLLYGRRSSCRCPIGSQTYSRQPGHPKRCRCYQPLPPLDPRFIVQPVKI